MNEIESLKREIYSSNRDSTILINLVNELHDDLEIYEVPVELLQKTNAVFNSPDIAQIIRDKQEANTFFSQNGVSMPNCTITKSNKIFSNTRIGSMDEVYVYEDSKIYVLTDTIQNLLIREFGSNMPYITRLFG